MSASTVDPAQFARYVPLNALQPDNQGKIAQQCQIRELAAGATVFSIGDAADEALFVLAGEVHLLDAERKALSRVRAGEPASFHRLAHQSPRRVTARCATPVRLLAVDAGLLDVMLTWDQTGAFEVGELGDSSADDDWMSRLLQMRTFQMVPPSNLQAMFMRMQRVTVAPGEVIVKQGDPGDFFYVIHSGKCIVTREQPGQKSVRLAELAAGACFGEEALIASDRRNATVTALTRCELMRLSQADFKSLLNNPLAREIGFDEAQAQVDAGKAKWLDVRLPSEFKNGHLPSAVNMPLYMLRMRLAQLDMSTTWIACCDTGRRSSVAVFVLTQKGYDAFTLAGGLPSDTAE